MDSMWTNSNSLTIGRRQGGSGSLRVSQGGQVSNTSAFVGSEAGSVGTVHVSGIGSTWTNSGILYLGYAGSGTLRVESGGKVAMQSGFLGYHSGSIGTATITGSGSSLSNLNSYLHIGLNGIGILRVEQGGNVNNTFARLGWGPGSIGTATVSGSGSVWENESSLDVGLRGLGTLRVEKGGRVESLTGQLGVDWEGTGTVTITGAGSAWRNQLSLYVGSSGSGTLTIDNGGLVSVGGPLTIDYNGGMDSFINMATGGMLALWGDADNSLQQFLALVSGTDAIRYWDNSLDTWEPLVNATYGDDYTLKYLTTGDLAGYTLLTVGTMTSGDYDHDGDVDGRDFLQWQRRHPLLIDLSVWQSTYANGTLGSMASVPEPTLTTYLLGLLLLPHRLGHRRGRSCIFSGLRTHIRSLS
jgi:T5SS/PEP-CTERM-associated repeat protein